ncbi:MAG: short-chain dehydrogenase/reductase SDR, partial [Candidatus Frackibacter sp. T328-2]
KDLEENREQIEEFWLKPTPMKRMGQPEELQGAALYLASDASSFMTGHTMIIDGGYTIY